MESKRPVAVLIPYRSDNGGLSVYLQKRSQYAKRNPGYFAFFGGGIEGDESPEESLKREINEELGFALTDFESFGVYESPHAVLHVYTLAVPSDFERTVTVQEGDFGKFFTEEEVSHITDISETDKSVLHDFYKSTRIP